MDDLQATAATAARGVDKASVIFTAEFSCHTPVDLCLKKARELQTGVKSLINWLYTPRILKVPKSQSITNVSPLQLSGHMSGLVQGMTQLLGPCTYHPKVLAHMCAATCLALNSWGHSISSLERIPKTGNPSSLQDDSGPK